jgi:hypothetical protein
MSLNRLYGLLHHHYTILLRKRFFYFEKSQFRKNYNEKKYVSLRQKQQNMVLEEKIINLDFGSQYTQLIARRVRELNPFPIYRK